MRLYKELNIFEDKRLFLKINLLSIVMVIALIIAALMGQAILRGGVHLDFSVKSYMWIAGITFISLFIHELIHGIFFKLFSESGSVKYGFAKGMLYAANPGVVYTKRQFIVIALAPFVINSGLFLLLSLFGLNSTILWAVFIFHTSGCAGDFWYVYELVKNPAISHCEDTPVGVKFFVTKEKDTN